jgi:hypothetical protein
MAISNELSGDIAAAMLAAKEISPGKMSDLKETILKIHSVLQEMSDRTQDQGSLADSSSGMKANAAKQK